jgi:hypothetical protein
MTEQEQDENFKKSLDLIEKWGEENKPPTLYQIIHDELGYSHDCTAEIIDAVKEWLGPSHPTNTYEWERCLKLMREKLE